MICFPELWAEGQLYGVRGWSEADDCGRAYEQSEHMVDLCNSLCDPLPIPLYHFYLRLWTFVTLHTGPASIKLSMFLLREYLILPI